MKKIFLLSAALSSLIFAKTIDFETALKEGLQNNLELKAKKLNIDKAKSDLDKAKSYDWGKFIFSTEFSRTNDPLYVFGMKLESREAAMKDFGFTQMPPAGTNVGPMQPKALNYPGPRSNIKTKFVYEVPIFTGFKLTYAKEMAKLQVLANKFKYEADKEALAIEILKAYNGAVAAKEFIKALETAKKTTSDFVKTVNQFYNQGMATEIDLLNVKKRDNEVNAMLIEAKNKYQLALSYLRFLTDDKDITDVGDFKVIISPSSSLKDLQKLALKNRSDLKWMQKNVETMEKKVKFEKSANYPTIGAHFEYGWNDKDLTFSSKKDYWVVAGGLNYNIYDGSKKADIEKSKIESLQTGLYYAYMKKGIKLQVTQKLLDLKAKSAVIKEKMVNKELASQILKKYTYMYKQGMVNSTILLLKEAQKRKADAEFIKAKYDQAIAAAELKKAIGNLVKEIK